MDDLYANDYDNGMVSHETLHMMFTAFGLSAMELNNAFVLSGGV